MNGKTARQLNKAATTYRVKARHVKRAWNQLNQDQKAEARGNLFLLCMELKKEIQAINRRKAVRKKKRVKNWNKIYGETEKLTKKNNAGLVNSEPERPVENRGRFRRFVDWFFSFLKLRRLYSD